MDSNVEQPPKSENSFSQWLEKLQQESWQLELIISGIAILGIWEARTGIGGLWNYIQVYSASYFANFGWIVTFFFLKTSWTILFTNLVIHVISRGLWIGAIGLRYISGDIDFKELDYSPRFERFLKKRTGNFDDYIAKLERFSSIVFAYTFLLVAFAISFAFFFLFFFGSVFLLEEYLGEGEDWHMLYLVIFLLGAIIVFIDFITLGSIKKVEDKTISTIYFFLFRFYSFISFSFLFRSFLYNFLDNKYARRFFLFSIPYVVIIVLSSGFIDDPIIHFPIQDYQHIHDPAAAEKLSLRTIYYDEDRQNYPKGIFNIKPAMRFISLPKKVFTANYGELFLEIRPIDKAYFNQKKNINPYNKDEVLHIIRSRDGNHFEDKKIKQLETQRDSILKIHISKKIKIFKKLKKDSIKNVIAGVKIQAEKMQLDSAYWKTKRDSISEIWEKKIEEAKVQKAYSLMDAMMELNEITIDDQPFNDSLNCQFYIHPNLGRRGLQCYFSTKNLADGPHTLKLKRIYDIERDSADQIINLTVPFFIYKDNQ